MGCVLELTYFFCVFVTSRFNQHSILVPRLELTYFCVFVISRFNQQSRKYSILVPRLDLVDVAGHICAAKRALVDRNYLLYLEQGDSDLTSAEHIILTSRNDGE